MLFSRYSMITQICIPLYFLCILSSVFVHPVSSQQIKANVTLMLERLPLEKQQRLKDFSEEIVTYLNNYDWTGEVLDEPIPVTIQIFLNDNSVSYEERFAGTFLISNNSDIQYYDKYWRFPYQAGNSLEHNENVFHPMTGFLDFYVYLIIAGEYDKFGKLLGEPYFERSKQLSEQGMFDITFVKGWEERSDLIEYILSDDYKSYRLAKDLFFLGKSYIGEEDTTSQKLFGEAVDMLDTLLELDPEHKAALQFIQAHHLEFIDLLKEDPERLRKLMIMDPDRADTYKQYLE